MEGYRPIVGHTGAIPVVVGRSAPIQQGGSGPVAAMKTWRASVTFLPRRYAKSAVVPRWCPASRMGKAQVPGQQLDDQRRRSKWIRCNGVVGSQELTKMAGGEGGRRGRDEAAAGLIAECFLSRREDGSAARRRAVLTGLAMFSAALVVTLLAGNTHRQVSLVAVRSRILDRP